MIMHCVSWKLKATDEAQREIDFEKIRSALEPLIEVIPQIVSIRVRRNVAYPQTNSDVLLVSEYANLDDLETYQQHPEHKKAAAVFRDLVSNRAAIDVSV